MLLKMFLFNNNQFFCSFWFKFLIEIQFNIYEKKKENKIHALNS